MMCFFLSEENVFISNLFPFYIFLCQQCLWFANVALLNGSSCHVINTQCLLCVSRKDTAEGKTLYTGFGVLMFSITQLRKRHIKMYLNWWDLIDTWMVFRRVFPWMEIPWATDIAPTLWFLDDDSLKERKRHVSCPCREVPLLLEVLRKG